MVDFPTDTILDSDPIFDDLEEEIGNGVKAVMKAIYLGHPMSDSLHEDGFTNTEIINAAEMLRRNGMIRVCTDGDKFWIEIIQGGGYTGGH